jgi:ABC-type enterobactin transport system permease subunit
MAVSAAMAASADTAADMAAVVAVIADDADRDRHRSLPKRRHSRAFRATTLGCRLSRCPIS